jgi:hypothetical protein
MERLGEAPMSSHRWGNGSHRKRGPSLQESFVQHANRSRPGTSKKTKFSTFKTSTSFKADFMKRRSQTQTPKEVKARPCKSSRQSFSGVETLFAANASRKASKTLKKMTQRFSNTIMKRKSQQQNSVHNQSSDSNFQPKAIHRRDSSSNSDINISNHYHHQQQQNQQRLLDGTHYSNEETNGEAIHENACDDCGGVPSSQPVMNEDDAIDIAPEENDGNYKDDQYEPPESALFSSKKKSTFSIPMSPSATPRNKMSSSSSSSLFFSGSSAGSGTANSTFHQLLTAVPSSSSSNASSFSSLRTSANVSGTSWRSAVDKSLALSSVGGGKIHRALAQSPSSVFKSISSPQWLDCGNSSGRGVRGSVNKRGLSWLDRNRNRLRSGKCGELARQVLEMQEDVTRKVEQLKGFEFQQSMMSTTIKKKRKSFTSRSDPRSGAFIELKVMKMIEVDNNSQAVALCKRATMKIMGEGKQKQMSENVVHQQSNVQLVLNRKRAKDIDLRPDCIVRIFEPWLDLPAKSRYQNQHEDDDRALPHMPDLLVASNLIVKV